MEIRTMQVFMAGTRRPLFGAGLRLAAIAGSFALLAATTITPAYAATCSINLVGSPDPSRDWECTISTDESDIGPKGDQGERGATGAKGADGAPGGPKGDTGSQGVAGADGADGAKGETGQQGATGAAGATGAQGATGAKGDKGDRGETGAAGKDGKDGRDFGMDEALALSAALSIPVWLEKGENFSLSGGLGFTGNATAVGLTGISRLDKNWSAFAGGAVDTDGDNWVGKAGFRAGW